MNVETNFDDEHSFGDIAREDASINTALVAAGQLGQCQFPGWTLISERASIKESQRLPAKLIQLCLIQE